MPPFRSQAWADGHYCTPQSSLRPITLRCLKTQLESTFLFSLIYDYSPSYTKHSSPNRLISAFHEGAMFPYIPDSLLVLLLGPLGPHPVSAYPRGSGYEHDSV